MAQKIISMKVTNLQSVIIGKLHFKDHPVVEVSGDNEDGKTSFLLGLNLILQGKKALGLEPVKKGEKEATVEADFTDIHVKVTVTHKGKVTYLVTDKSTGETFKNRDLIKKFLGGVEINPDSMMLMSELEKYRVAMGMTGKEDEIEDLNKQRKVAFAKRTTANGIYNRASAQLQGMEIPNPKLPTEEIPASVLTDEMDRIHKIELKKNTAQGKVVEIQKDLTSVDNDIYDISENIKDLEGKLMQAKNMLADKGRKKSQFDEELKSAELEYEAITVPPTSEIEAKIKAIKVENEAIRDAKVFHEKKAECKELGRDVIALETEIETIDAKKLAILKDAKLPVKGLTVDTANEILRYNGKPLKSESTARQMAVWSQILIALSKDAPIFVLWNASVVGSKIRKEIVQYAFDAGAQGIFESISQSELSGVIFENGFGTEKEATKELDF